MKSNIGHLEGASGIAGLIKAVLVLEKGLIPPNAIFENLNPKIDLDYLRIKLPQELTKWPTKGLRRASINSFGFGGSNSHVILDDAYHYLRAAGLQGHHNTSVDPETPEDEYVHIGANGYITPQTPTDALEETILNSPAPPKLLVLSANDESTLTSQAHIHTSFFRDTQAASSPDYEFLNNLLYTLNERRYLFPWRAAGLLSSSTDLGSLDTLLSKPQRSVKDPSICFVFTGQGAQYPGDKLRCLEQFKVFRRRLKDAEEYLSELGCPWRVRGMFHVLLFLRVC